MFTYQRFPVSETDHFEEAKYPQINRDLRAIGLLLGDAAGTPGAAMLLSFVRYHSISSTSVTAYPALANIISTRELPVSGLEELFEASKKNPTFQKELETHIESYLNSHNRAFPHNKSSI
ncbi:MAG: hypothetical protein EOO53_19700 [Gammaproteobacteria bacterium]|nr:MAG: hypothetical protein EOO53_19700 [Gammaproteobacteria bacterium]